MRFFPRTTRVTATSSLFSIVGCVFVAVAPVARGLSSSSTSTPSRPEGRPRKIRALRQICSQPLAFTIDDFCDVPMCHALAHGSEDARLQFAVQIAGELFAGTWGRNDGLRHNLSTSSDANNNNNQHTYPEGLHVDTNNESIFRSVTAILYLNNIPHGSGGATVFPLADAPSEDPRLAAAQRLLHDRLAHTRGSATTTTKPGTAGEATRAADAAQLETSSAATGLRIQPETGKLLLFFSRTEGGEIDPRSWHGGERLIVDSSHDSRSGEGEDAHDDAKEGDDDAASNTQNIVKKSIMTLFKEIDYGTAHPDVYETTFEDYLAPQIKQQRRALQSLAEAHAPFFEQ